MDVTITHLLEHRCLLFAVGLTAMSTWGPAAAALIHGISDWTGSTINAHAVFALGMIAGTSSLAAFVLYGVCRSYRNMNPIEAFHAEGLTGAQQVHTPRVARTVRRCKEQLPGNACRGFVGRTSC